MSIDPSQGPAAIAAFAGEVRGKTLKILNDAKDHELRWAPPGLSNHVLWYAGHCLWVNDILGIEAILGKSELPAGWAETFGKTGRSPRDTQEWPSRERVAELLEQQLPRLQALVSSLNPGSLLEPPCGTKLGTDRPLWWWVVHAIQDEAGHQGEMYLLLKLQRKGKL